MSFFSNPLAEEDEVVPPDYPLGQYDERKREDDFNELLVRSSKLEAAQRTHDDAASTEQPALVACLQQNQQIRSTLEDLWVELRDGEAPALTEAAVQPSSSLPPLLASAVPLEVVDAVAEQMHAELSQLQTASGVQRSGVALQAAQLVADAPPSGASLSASAFTAFRTATRHATNHSATEAHVDAPDTAEVEAAVQALDAQLPHMSAEEAALATAAVHHLLCGLQSSATLTERHAALQRSVAAKAQEQQQAHLAAQTVALWAASRQLAGEAATSAESTAPASTAVPPLSFDLALAEQHNRRLNVENLRLEAALARLLAEQPETAQTTSSLAGSALVHYVGLLDQTREVEEAVQRLGTGVLFLRAALADPASADVQELVKSAASSSCDTADAVASCESMWAARQAQINAVERLLQAPLPDSSEVAAAAPTDCGVQGVLLRGLTRLQELYDACLGGVALISAYLSKQSAAATFLLHAARGGGALDDATLERVLEVPEVDTLAVREALDEAAETCAELSVELQGLVESAAHTSAATLARWDAVRSLLTDLLRHTLMQLPQDSASAQEMRAMLAAYASSDRARGAPATALRDVVQSVPSWAAVLHEEVGVYRAEKAAQRKRVRDYWLTQQAEANKKLTWLRKQPNAPLLLQLCAAEKERADLLAQLELQGSAPGDPAGLQDALDDVTRAVAAEAAHNATLQEAVEEMEASALQLVEERAALLAALQQDVSA